MVVEGTLVEETCFQKQHTIFDWLVIDSIKELVLQVVRRLALTRVAKNRDISAKKVLNQSQDWRLLALRGPS